MTLVELIKKIQVFYPLKGIMAESVRNFFEVKYNYNSNAIEWTTFTEEQTVEVLRGNSVPYHIMREHFEVINHKKAFDLVIQLSKLPWKEVFTEKNFLNIHEIILTNINDEYAGRYRNVNVRILNSNEVFPNHLKVPDLMEVFVKDFLERYEHLDVHNVETVLKYGYDLHRNFVKIHPFIDWNGRSARFLMNLWFLHIFNFIDVIYMTNRKTYIASLSSGDMNDYYTFMNQNFEEFLKEFLELLEENMYFKI